MVGFGSSALYRYLNSPLLWKQQGITSYGIATAAQPVYVIPSLIDEVEKTQSPQLYIIETRRFTDTDNEVIKENRLRQIADNMKVSWNRFKMVTELTEGFEDRLSYGFDLIKYHGNWENLTEESWEYLFNAKEHPLKGWSVNSRHKILSYLDVKDITGEIPITEKSEKELREIIEKCKRKYSGTFCGNTMAGDRGRTAERQLYQTHCGRSRLPVPGRQLLCRRNGAGI